VDIDSLIASEFSRNIGLLKEDEQRRLLAARVAVAGAGGVGGLHILTLARMGVGSFTIADPDVFEAVNVSRQFGAGCSTFNANKAEVLGRMVLDINPQATVRVIAGPIDEVNVDDFLDGAQVFVDGIDFFEFDVRRLIFKRCRAKGIPAITAAPLGFGATLQVFSPSGMSFDDYFGIKEGMSYLEKLAAFAAGLAPHPYHIKYLDLTKVSLERKTGPAVAPACTLASSLVATEVVKLITGKGEVRPVPAYVQIDLLRGKHKRGYLLWGGKNPLQRLKRWIILRKAGGAGATEGA
jgi:molybdopterin/thiamine biosynthesis adenylyltransferase